MTYTRFYFETSNLYYSKSFIKYCGFLFLLSISSGSTHVVEKPVVERIWVDINRNNLPSHYSDVIMRAMASQIVSLSIVYSTLYSGDQRKHQSSASLAFVWGIHRWPVTSPNKGPVTRKKVSYWWRHHCNSGYQTLLIAISCAIKSLSQLLRGRWWLGAWHVLHIAPKQMILLKCWWNFQTLLFNVQSYVEAYSIRISQRKISYDQ